MVPNWTTDYPYEDDIEISLEKVKAISLNKLIGLLTSTDRLDVESASILFLTHRSFVSSVILLKKLIARYHVPPNYINGEVIQSR